MATTNVMVNPTSLQTLKSKLQDYYTLTKPAESVSLKIMDVEGKTLRELRGSAEPGLHHVAWDLTAGTDGAGKGKKGGMGAGGKKGGKAGGKKGLPEEIQPGGLAPFAGLGGRLVPPGAYRVVLVVDDREFSHTLRVEADPATPRPLGGSEEEEAFQRR